MGSVVLTVFRVGGENGNHLLFIVMPDLFMRLLYMACFASLKHPGFYCVEMNRQYRACVCRERERESVCVCVCVRV